MKISSQFSQVWLIYGWGIDNVLYMFSLTVRGEGFEFWTLGLWVKCTTTVLQLVAKSWTNLPIFATGSHPPISETAVQEWAYRGHLLKCWHNLLKVVTVKFVYCFNLSAVFKKIIFCSLDFFKLTCYLQDLFSGTIFMISGNFESLFH